MFTYVLLFCSNIVSSAKGSIGQLKNKISNFVAHKRHAFEDIYDDRHGRSNSQLRAKKILESEADVPSASESDDEIPYDYDGEKKYYKKKIAERKRRKRTVRASERWVSSKVSAWRKREGAFEVNYASNSRVVASVHKIIMQEEHPELFSEGSNEGRIPEQSSYQRWVPRPSSSAIAVRKDEAVKKELDSHSEKLDQRRFKKGSGLDPAAALAIANESDLSSKERILDDLARLLQDSMGTQSTEKVQGQHSKAEEIYAKVREKYVILCFTLGRCFLSSFVRLPSGESLLSQCALEQVCKSHGIVPSERVLECLRSHGKITLLIVYSLILFPFVTVVLEEFKAVTYCSHCCFRLFF